MSTSARPQPECRRCAHYYVTHDARFPHGCRAMGFKSATQPAREVLAASGQPCLRFVASPPS